MIDVSKVNEIVLDWVSSRENFFIVEISIKPSNSVFVEIDNYKGVTIEDCVALHEVIEQHLDRDIYDYDLEVSSAGLGYPFKVQQQYIKHISDEVEVLTKTGQKFHGILISTDVTGFVLKTKLKVKCEGSKRSVEKEEDVHYGYEEIKYTKYLIRFK